MTVGTSDVSFRAGFGVYLGAVAASLVLVVGVLVDASTGLLVAAFPNVLTVVTIASAILAERVAGLAERIGRTRWRRVSCGLAPLAFVAFPIALAISPLEASSRLVVACTVGAVLTALPAVGVAVMARNRYVDALTSDEPAVTVPWHNSRQSAVWYGFAVITFVMGSALFLLANDFRGLLWAGYGLFLLATQVGSRLEIEWLDVDWQNPATTSELCVHEAGIVKKRPYARSLVPWETVTGVRLTDDELVIERRWLDLRCDRSELDDPEAVRATVERLWRRVDGITPGWQCKPL